MDNERARFILRAYRPGGQDADAPELAEALAQAERDPELKAWFERERQFDQALARKLSATPPPDDLLDNILAGTQVSRGKSRRWGWLALPAAAAVILFLSLAHVWTHRYAPSGPITFTAYQQDMLGFLGSVFRLEFKTTELAPIQQWLKERPAVSSARFPTGVQDFEKAGCRVVPWHDREVALVCFLTEGEWVHVFILPRSSLPDAPAGEMPHVARMANWSTARWSQGDLIYFVATTANEEFLRRRLEKDQAHVARRMSELNRSDSFSLKL